MEFKYLISQSLSFDAINELKGPRVEFINEILSYSKIFSVSFYFKLPKYLEIYFCAFHRTQSKTISRFTFYNFIMLRAQLYIMSILM